MIYTNTNLKKQCCKLHDINWTACSKAVEANAWQIPYRPFSPVTRSHQDSGTNTRWMTFFWYWYLVRWLYSKKNCINVDEEQNVPSFIVSFSIAVHTPFCGNVHRHTIKSYFYCLDDVFTQCVNDTFFLYTMGYELPPYTCAQVMLTEQCYFFTLTYDLKQVLVRQIGLQQWLSISL